MVREYVGTGPLAVVMAEADAEERARLMADREALRAEQEQSASIDTSVRELCEISSLMTKATMLLAGFRQHNRGEWRKRRAKEAG